MATTSFGSSTTQMIAGSRRGSLQIRQTSAWATLPQTEQNLTSFLTRSSVAASRSTSVASVANRWNAIRWALFGPTPGRRPSSSIRSWTAPSYMRLQTRQAHAAERTAESARHRAHLLFGELANGSMRISHRGDHEILPRLDVVRVDRLRVDPERHELPAAVERRADQAAPGRAGDLGRRQLGLRGRELLLHLLGLLHQLLHVRLLPAELPASLRHVELLRLATHRSETSSPTLMGAADGCRPDRRAKVEPCRPSASSPSRWRSSWRPGARPRRPGADRPPDAPPPPLRPRRRARPPRRRARPLLRRRPAGRRPPRCAAHRLGARRPRPRPHRVLRRRAPRRHRLPRAAGR